MPHEDDCLPPLDVAQDEADEQDAREAEEVERFFWFHIRNDEFDGECPF